MIRKRSHAKNDCFPVEFFWPFLQFLRIIFFLRKHHANLACPLLQSQLQATPKGCCHCSPGLVTEGQAPSRTLRVGSVGSKLRAISMDGQVQTMLKPPRDGHQLGGETKFHHPFFGHPDVSHDSRFWQNLTAPCTDVPFPLGAEVGMSRRRSTPAPQAGHSWLQQFAFSFQWFGDRLGQCPVPLYAKLSYRRRRNTTRYSQGMCAKRSLDHGITC